MRSLHVDFAWVVVISNLVAGVWAGAAHWVEALRHRALWWCTVLAEVTIALEIVFGVWLVARDDLVAAEFHQFYGFVTLIVVMIMYGYREQVPSYRYLLYGGGGLFLMGLAIRAMTLRNPV